MGLTTVLLLLLVLVAVVVLLLLLLLLLLQAAMASSSRLHTCSRQGQCWRVTHLAAQLWSSRMTLF
jgi:hypothetical protein